MTERLGWVVRNGAHMTPSEPAAERECCSQNVVEQRLRDTLLPKLMSGEIRARHADNFVRPVV